MTPDRCLYSSSVDLLIILVSRVAVRQTIGRTRLIIGLTRLIFPAGEELIGNSWTLKFLDAESTYPFVGAREPLSGL